jgi:hypothetical protein
MKLLDDLQNQMYRTLLCVPKSTPMPALCWDMGGILMKYRIMQKKLVFLSHLKNLDKSTLARQVLDVQVQHRMDGLVQEFLTFCAELKIPNIVWEEIPHEKWKIIVGKAIKLKNEETLVAKMMNSKKIQKSDMVTETFKRRDYISNMLLSDSRTMFQYRSSMTEHVKMNYSSDPKYKAELWKCDSCQVSIDTQDHVLWCPSYSELRQGRNLTCDTDLTRYLHDVLVIRQKLNLNK